MTSYVNNHLLRHIRKAVLALVATSFGVAQLGVPLVKAGSLMPRPGLDLKLSVHAETGAIVVNKGKIVPTTIEGKRPATLKTIYMDSTAYTSTVEECDSDPFVTADGSDVADGIVATNVLPFGTKIRLPTVFGDRIFEVHDRMNARYTYRVDIWMDDYKTMINYGLKRNIPIEVVSYGDNKTVWAARAAKMKQERLAKKAAHEIALAIK